MSRIAIGTSVQPYSFGDTGLGGIAKALAIKLSKPNNETTKR
jgi:hypothetical protein